jgi:hypothetical protein
MRQLIQFPIEPDYSAQPAPGNPKNLFVRQWPSPDSPESLLELEQWAFEGAFSPNFSPLKRNKYIFFKNDERILYESDDFETLLFPVIPFPQKPDS